MSRKKSLDYLNIYLPNSPQKSLFINMVEGSPLNLAK